MNDTTPLMRVVMLHLLVQRLLFRREEQRGASAVEYGLLVAGIAAVIVGVVFLFGQGIFLNLFTNTCNSIGQNMGSTC